MTQRSQVEGFEPEDLSSYNWKQVSYGLLAVNPYIKRHVNTLLSDKPHLIGSSNAGLAGVCKVGSAAGAEFISRGKSWKQEIALVCEQWLYSHFRQ